MENYQNRQGFVALTASMPVGFLVGKRGAPVQAIDIPLAHFFRPV